MRRLRSLLAHKLRRRALKAATSWRVGIGSDIGGRFYGIGAEQLSRAGQQGAHLVELLLQRRISHVPTLPRPSRLHNSLAE